MTSGINWYLHVFFIFINTELTHEFWLASEGTLSTTSKYVFIGDSFTLECHLEDTSKYTASSLCFKNDQGHKLNSTQVSLPNNRTARITVSVRKEEDGGSYKCYAQCSVKKFIGLIRIFVEYPPQMITELRCFRRNWNPLECFWHNPIKYIVPEVVAVGLQYLGNNGNTGNCSHFVTNTHCKWLHTLVDQFVRINVTVTNTKAGRSISSLGPQIERSKIVEPDPPDNFTAVAISSTCAILSWKHSATHRKLLFSVSIYSSSGQLIEEVKKTTETNNTVVELTVCNLHPFMNYSFHIKCIPLIDREPSGYWSESRSVTVQTYQSVPAGAPPLLPGLYTSGKCIEDKREVSFNWKDVKESEKNGYLTGYKLQACATDKPNACLEKVISQGNIFTVSLHLNCFRGYNVQITAKTSIGYSEVHSIVHVEKSIDQLVQPKYLVVHTTLLENKLNELALRWIPGNNNIDGSENVVVWCEKDNVKYACKGPINWKHCGKNTSALIDVVNPFKSIYGIYTMQAGKSSGIIWTHCIYLLNATDVKPPENLNVEVPAASRSLTITWTPPDCSESKAYITHYIIEYCTAGIDKTCEGEKVQKMIISEDTDYSFTLTELEPDTQYRITMLSVTTNASSLETVPLFGTPVDYTKNM